MSNTDPPYGQLMDRIHDLCTVLRGSHGCAWDRAQTSASLAPFLVEEMHEMLEALSIEDREHLIEETGDCVYLWTFFLQTLETEKKITLAAAVDAAEEKLTRRHPHVFGTETAPTGIDALGHWERQKRAERKGHEILPRLPASLPALSKARRLQEKAAAYRFDWNTRSEVLDKIREELDELSRALGDGPDRSAVREELGDLLFSVVNLARHLDQDPEATLFAATEKFRTRFNEMARAVEATGHRMGDLPVESLESYWQTVKQRSTSDTPLSDQE